MVPVERDDLVVMMEAGYVYLGMRRLQEARDVFEGVSVLAPLSEVPLVALGSAWFAEGKFDKAIQCYQKALKLSPKSSFAHAYTGETLFFQGKKGEAIASLNKAVSLDPEGKSGNFAHALLEAIQKGFAPAFNAKGLVAAG